MLHPTVLPNTLPQSLLLKGATLEEGCALAKELLGPEHTKKVDLGSHPDLHLYMPEGKSRLHPISSMQQLIEEMSMPPYEARMKIFLIAEADRMLPPAANALLKTLEEPAADTYFLLLTHHSERLLSTILSRLHPLKYTPNVDSSPDLSPFFALAQRGEWDLLLDRLPELEEVDPDPLLQGCLSWAAAQRDPEQFQEVSHLVGKIKEAMHHNVKPLNALLFLFLRIG